MAAKAVGSVGEVGMVAAWEAWADGVAGVVVGEEGVRVAARAGAESLAVARVVVATAEARAVEGLEEDLGKWVVMRAIWEVEKAAVEGVADMVAQGGLAARVVALAEVKGLDSIHLRQNRIGLQLAVALCSPKEHIRPNRANRLPSSGHRNLLRFLGTPLQWHRLHHPRNRPVVKWVGRVVAWAVTAALEGLPSMPSLPSMVGNWQRLGTIVRV